VNAQDQLNAAIGAEAAHAMVLESLIEMLVARGLLKAGEILEAIDNASWAVEEQPVSPGFPAATKAAQHGVLQSLLARLADHPAFRDAS
jgi:hypothetical protein